MYVISCTFFIIFFSLRPTYKYTAANTKNNPHEIINHVFSGIIHNKTPTMGHHTMLAVDSTIDFIESIVALFCHLIYSLVSDSSSGNNISSIKFHITNATIKNNVIFINHKDNKSSPYVIAVYVII